MKTVRKISGAAAATLLLGATIAVAAPLSAHAAQTASDAPRPTRAYGPYDSEGTCNYWRAQIPGQKSICFHNGSDGWYFTTPN